MSAVIVDSNVLLDLFTQDPNWLDWSSDALSKAADQFPLIINPIIYAEISTRFTRIEDLDALIVPSYFKREALPYEAAFLAAKAFMSYKKNGGAKHTTLPDFFIGSHAATRGYTILTRDVSRYRTYFPTVKLISPYIG